MSLFPQLIYMEGMRRWATCLSKRECCWNMCLKRARVSTLQIYMRAACANWQPAALAPMLAFNEQGGGCKLAKQGKSCGASGQVACSKSTHAYGMQQVFLHSVAHVHVYSHCADTA